jgi:hypothetical protein
MGGRLGGWCVRYGWIDGRREKVRGEYGFSSLVKQNKKGKKFRCLLLRRKKKIIIFIFTL